MQIASESQQKVPTFFTSFLLTKQRSDHKKTLKPSCFRPQKPGKHELPVLQVRIVFANCWYCYKPPQHQPIYNYRISRRNPKAKLQKESIEFHGQEDNAKAQNLNKAEWTKKWVPFVFIPHGRSELSKSSFDLKIKEDAISFCLQ